MRQAHSRTAAAAVSVRADPTDVGRVEASIQAATRFLLSLQRPDGHWRAELEGDTILESEYILLMQFVDRQSDPRVRKAANYLLQAQMADGGWSNYPGGPADVSASVKNYFALKLAGESPSSEAMLRARRRIRELGGIEATNSFTRIYLAIFGQYPWSLCPAVPPEIVLLPRWCYFNLYAMSSWSRAIVVPLSIVWAHRPCLPVPQAAAIPELMVGETPADTTPRPPSERAWRALFRAIDAGIKIFERWPLNPLRRIALRRAERWIVDRLAHSDGLGAIFPPIVNSIFAFRCLGREIDDPLIQTQLRHLEALEIEESETLRVQPCLSPVWDTLLGVRSLIAAGVRPDDERLQRAASWIVDREVTRTGDWAVGNRDAEPGGWCFEYANEFYPDCDDTAEALIALRLVRFDDPAADARCRGALDRALRWQLSMQNRDGGWAAFDRGCDRELLRHVPFADHNAMLDPSTADITARTLVALRAHGLADDDDAVRRGQGFLLAQQERDGSWYGRWGCNYLYGTWLAMTALAPSPEAACQRALERGAAWLAERQNDDGGWGESCASYDDPALAGRGDSCASQTGWALLALLAAGHSDSTPVERGIEYLVASQRADGSWYEDSWTGTGFPRVFYLRYHLYATHFPLETLSAYRAATAGDGPSSR